MGVKLTEHNKRLC